jgi:hypothetical protein
MAWNFIPLQGLKPFPLLDVTSGLKPRPPKPVFFVEIRLQWQDPISMRDFFYCFSSLCFSF